MYRAAVANAIIVVDYDPNWPSVYESLRKRIADVLADLTAAIEHVRSTAVPNLAAKPIIDIDVLLKSEEMMPAAIKRLASISYIHLGNLGIADREAFCAPTGDPPHHLYVCPPRSAEFRRHLAFRNYLRTHPADAKIYGDLQWTLAERFRGECPAYLNAKSELVEALAGQTIGAAE